MVVRTEGLDIFDEKLGENHVKFGPSQRHNGSEILAGLENLWGKLSCRGVVGPSVSQAWG